jgi:hypothetical protein
MVFSPILDMSLQIKRWLEIALSSFKRGEPSNDWDEPRGTLTFSSENYACPVSKLNLSSEESAFKF